MCDFVDTTKAICGSSGSEEEDFFKNARSKAAREDLESENPTRTEGKAKNREKKKQ